MADHKLEAKDLTDICSELDKVTPEKLLEIGAQLKIDTNTLKEFKSDNTLASTVFSHWLNGNTVDGPTATWESIVTVLKSKYVSEVGLAEKIEKKYCTDCTEGSSKVEKQETTSETLQVSDKNVGDKPSEKANVDGESCTDIYDAPQEERNALPKQNQFFINSDADNTELATVDQNSEGISKPPIQVQGNDIEKSSNLLQQKNSLDQHFINEEEFQEKLMREEHEIKLMEKVHKKDLMKKEHKKVLMQEDHKIKLMEKEHESELMKEDHKIKLMKKEYEIEHEIIHMKEDDEKEHEIKLMKEEHKRELMVKEHEIKLMKEEQIKELMEKKHKIEVMKKEHGIKLVEKKEQIQQEKRLEGHKENGASEKKELEK